MGRIQDNTNKYKTKKKKRDALKVVNEIGKIFEKTGSSKIRGSFIPHSWWLHLTKEGKKGKKVQPSAAIILADIVYWYRPKREYDTTGNELDWDGKVAKRFKSDMLQRNYEQLEEMYGFTKNQSRDAIDFLVERGYIIKEMRTVGSSSNVMYMEPIPDKIAKITYRIEDK